MLPGYSNAKAGLQLELSVVEGVQWCRCSDPCYHRPGSVQALDAFAADIIIPCKTKYIGESLSI